MKTLYAVTNIRLPKDVLKNLKIKAAYEGKSLAQLIREAIGKYILGEKTKKHKKDSFLNIIGIYSDGIKDGSVHHDRDIYGERR